MSKQQWTPPETDVLVQDKNTWQPPSTDVEVKKKSSEPASQSTSPSLPNGLENFQNSLTRTENTTPLSPQGHDDLAAHNKQISDENDARIKEANDKFAKAYKKLDPKTRETIEKVNALANTKPTDNLREPSQEELSHAEFMEKHPVVRALNYMGSEASHGTLQVLKGAAHEWNKSLGSPAADIANDLIFDKADKAADLGLTKTDIAKSEENKPTAALGMLANFAPAVAGGEALNAPKALMFLQGVGQGKELADKLDLNPNAKEALIQGSGAVNLLLSDIGSEYFGKAPSALKTDLVTGVTAEAIKESAGKELTAKSFHELLANKAATVAQKLEKAPLATLEHYTNTAKTLLKVDVGNFAVHKAVDALNDKPVFNETTGDLAHNLNKSITQDAPMLAAVPMAAELTKLTPFSGYKNDVIQHLVEKPDDAEAIKSQLRDHAQNNGWTPEETQATLAHVDKIAQASKSLPDIAPEKKAKGIELVIGRNDLQKKLADIQEQKKTLDPSIADLPSKSEEYLTDKIDQANDKLRTLITGKRTTYSNPEDGVYLKTTDGKAEKITENRYKLENLERTSKQQQNENNENAQKGHQEKTVEEINAKGQEDDGHEKSGEVNQAGAENVPAFTKEGDQSHAISEGKIEKNGVEEHQGTPQGEDIQKNSEQVREEKSGQAGDSNSTEPKEEELTHQEADAKFIKEETNPNEIAARYHTEQNYANEKEKAIIDYLGNSKINEKDYNRWGDRKRLGDHTDPKRLRWIDSTNSDSTGLDVHAEALSHELGYEVTPEDFIDVIDKYKGREHFNEESKSETQKLLEQRYLELTGKKLTPNIAEKAFTNKLNLTPKEHIEADELLQPHGITIKDIEDEQQERNGGSEAATATDADAKSLQQPENDGTGNAGKTPAGKTAQGEESPSATGIRNADVEKERGESVERTKKTKPEIDAEGKRLVDSGEVDPNELAKSIIEKPRPASAEEQAALLYHKTKLKNTNRELAKDPTPENQFEFAQNEDLLERNRKATEVIGNELGRGLGLRTDQMAEDYSRINILNRAKIANGGELDPKDERELTERTKRIEDLESKLAEREEQIRKLQKNSLVDKVKNAAGLEERQAKREVTKASLRKEREGLIAELHVIAKKSLKTTGANKIPVDMIIPLTKLARNYVLDGITTLSGVADKIYNDLKEHVDGLKKEHIEDILKDEFPRYLDEQNKIRLARAKKLQQTKLSGLKEQQETGNFEKKVIRKIQVDNDYLQIRADINREQAKINKKIADIENSKKSLNRKIVDIAVKYGRQAKLASVSVLGKLAATGLATIGLKPVTEGIGKVVSTVLPKTAERSSVEGKVSRSALKEANKVTEGAAVGSLAQAYGRAFTIGMKDAYNELSGAGSNLTNLYKERGATLPSEAKEFFGHVHSAIKAPIKRFAWEHSYAKRVAKNIQAGLDPMDPIRDAKNRLDAYKDGERAIFMGDNQLSKVYENAVGSLERSNSSSARTAAATMRILLPFVKVPSNIVLEGAKYSFGSVSGIARLGRALTKGMDNLTPEEADTILEHLKKGSIGGAAMLIGFYSPQIFGKQVFGGFYKGDDKPKIKPGHIKINDIDIPTSVIEHPIFIAAQVGANFRQLLDRYKHNDKKIAIAALATASGLTYQVPQADEVKRLVELTTNIKSLKKWEEFGGDAIKGFEPAMLQQLAKVTDPKPGANTNIPGLAFTDETQQKRQPETKRGKEKYKGMMKRLGDDLKVGLPIARETVKPSH